MADKEQIMQELNQFTGTTQYYKYFSLKLTDGIKHFAEKLGAFWLIDIVLSYQHELKKIPFQLWEIEVNQDKSASVTVREDSDTKPLAEQKVQYTDFPLDNYSFYVIDGVVLLRSEY